MGIPWTWCTMRDFAELVAGKRVAVVSHDAGAANIIAAGLAAARGAAQSLRAVVQGPAREIFTATTDLQFEPAVSIDAALHGADLLIAGTGWQTSLEFDGLRAAQRAAVSGYAVIDHWVNYPARFCRDGETVRPAAVIVTDEEAYAIAGRELPGWDRLLFPNHYLAKCLAEIEPLPRDADALLYLCEPANAFWGRDRPGEFQALDYALEKAQAAHIPPSAAWILRLHPSEPAGKYDDWAAAQRDRRVTIANEESLAVALSRARWVAGCQSFALTIALAAGRTVVSCLPPWAPRCQLPHDGIIHLRDRDR